MRIEVAKGTLDSSLNVRMPRRTRSGWRVHRGGAWSQGPCHEGWLTYEFGQDKAGAWFLRSVDGTDRRVVAIGVEFPDGMEGQDIAAVLYDAAVDAGNIELE